MPNYLKEQRKILMEKLRLRINLKPTSRLELIEQNKTELSVIRTDHIEFGRSNNN